MSGYKRFKSADVDRIYKQSYRQRYDWTNIIGDNINTYLEILEKCSSCPVTLSMGSLLPLVSSFAGPSTRIKVHSEMLIPLNCYSMCIAPSSATFANIINPVAEKYSELTGKSLILENYTTAGIQRHQQTTSGYGLITSDEGSRILSSINAKQARSEGALLCKLWAGKGDPTVLAGEERGFDETSMSMLLYVQPEPLMSELANLASGDDGFLERFIFFVAKPKAYKMAEVRQNAEKLAKYDKELLVNVFTDIYEEHRVETVYEFNPDAQKYMDSLIDEFADEINKKYASQSEDGTFQH